MPRIVPCTAIFGAFVLVSSAPAYAAPGARQPDLTPRVWIEAAAYFPVVDTDVRIDDLQTSESGTDIDFETDLDFATRKALPSVSAGVRFGGSWRLTGDFYRLARSKSATIEEEIEFDGVIYPAGGEVDATFRSDVFRLAVGKTFLKRRGFELGGSLGAHVTSFSVSLEGEGSVGSASGTFERRRRKVLAPLPTLGLFAEWKLAPRLEASAKVDALSIKIGDYKGKLVNGQASLSYVFTRHFAAGLMWRHVRYRLDVDKQDWEGRLRYGFSGPAVYLQARF